jgi:hypothetical protein
MSIERDDSIVLARVVAVAPGELTIVTGPHPNDPSRVGVFVRNGNSSRGILAAIRVDATPELMIESPSRLSPRQRWPLRFEVRVAPGSQVLLGFSILSIWRSLDSARDPDGLEMLVVNQRFIVEGAIYLDRPFPPIQELPEDFLWVYSIPIVNSPYYQWFDLFMNLHPFRQIEFAAVSSPNGMDCGGSVIPGEQLHVEYGRHQQSFRLTKVRFA